MKKLELKVNLEELAITTFDLGPAGRGHGGVYLLEDMDDVTGKIPCIDQQTTPEQPTYVCYSNAYICQINHTNTTCPSSAFSCGMACTTL